jgi:NADH-quinone oxidoreductase subunit L
VMNRVGDFGLIAAAGLLFWGLSGTFGAGGFEPAPARSVTVQAPGGVALGVAVTGTDAHPATVRTVQLGGSLVFREIGDQLALRDTSGQPGAVVVDVTGIEAKKLWGVPILFLVCLGLFLAAAGKSAQIPLQGWLADAMAGPTPVSALIHAATMVTAGVYLIARLSFLFVRSPGAMAVVAVAGALTALFGALCAIAQYDIKRILAFSTVSQLGFMFMALGVGAFTAGVFHLVTHACFKACLFLAAGAVIHRLDYLEDEYPDPTAPGIPTAIATASADDPEAQAPEAAHFPPHGESYPHPARDARRSPRRSDPQDLRNMGGLATLMPRTRRAYFLAALAIAGFPVAAGFYSKDAILWSVFQATAAPGLSPLATVSPLLPAAVWAIGFIAAGLTAFYIARSYYLAFYARPPSELGRASIHMAPRRMRTVLLVLAVASVAIGPLLGWPAAWGGRPLFFSWLSATFASSVVSSAVSSGAVAGAADPGATRALEWGLQLITVAVAFLGWMAARACFRDLARTGRYLAGLRARFDRPHALLYRQLGADRAYRQLGVVPALDFARAAAWIDRRVIDPALDLAARAVLGLARLSGRADVAIVDGAVGGLSDLVVRTGARAGRMETGRINSYLPL